MSAKAYLFVFAPKMGTQEEVKNIINNIPEIITWRYDMENCFYLISDANADFISKSIRERAGKEVRFIVAEITDNRQGWLTKETWDLLRNKKAEEKKTIE